MFSCRVVRPDPNLRFSGWISPNLGLLPGSMPVNWLWQPAAGEIWAAGVAFSVEPVDYRSRQNGRQGPRGMLAGDLAIIAVDIVSH